MNLIGEVISIGDEITSGQRLDTNSQWLSQRLTELGVRVVYHSTVADDLEANVGVFKTSIERADVVVATGGLGPTADDLTRQALAEATANPLVQDDEALAQIRALFERRGRTMPERNVVQALFPAGSRQIFNPHGTAPGVDMHIERPGRRPCRVFALPGVPGEMFGMWEASVAPAIVADQPTTQVIRHHCIKCFGAGESQIEAMLPDMIRRGREPSVGITASSATITLRITATAADEASCLATIQPTVAEIRDALGVLVFGEGDGELEHAVVNLLSEHDKTVAVSEGMTRGQLTQMLSDADAAGDRFLTGSIGKPPVSRVEQVAQETRVAAGADFGIAVSEIESVDGDPGSTQAAIALSSTALTRSRLVPLFGDAAFSKLRTAKIALNMLRLALLRGQT